MQLENRKNNGCAARSGPDDSLLWTVAEHPWAVECPWNILEEIHGAVREGYRRLSRGGVEVGGIVYGRRTGHSVRILAWCSMVCEHARGPAFLLSSDDRQSLIRQLDGAGTDQRFPLLEPLGWFVSHTRGGLRMTEADVELFQRHFPQPWQVTLVYNPGRQRETRAGFFVRQPDGVVRSEATCREFAVTGVRVPIANPPQPLEARTPVIPSPHRPQRVVGIASVLSLGALVLFAAPHFHTTAVSQDLLQLRLVDAQGHLQIEWDRNSAVLADAEGAHLFIDDGDLTPLLELDPEILRAGSILYARWSEDVAIRMAVKRKGQPLYQESVRYVGSPLQPPRTGRANLLLEARKLKVELQQAANRIQELQHSARRLQTQLERDRRRQ